VFSSLNTVCKDSGRKEGRMEGKKERKERNIFYQRPRADMSTDLLYFDKISETCAQL
jgi:hypothetical protein